MIEQIAEFDAYDLYLDYIEECKSTGDQPLEYFEWLKEEQIEPV